jgi:hypothetical protein
MIHSVLSKMFCLMFERQRLSFLCCTSSDTPKNRRFSIKETLMSETESLRAELLRQKIIFDAELRRQREVYEERLATAEEKLQDREIDCRNLQSVITILGKKLDTLQDHVTLLVHQRGSGGSGSQTPRRVASPSRSETHPSPFRRQPSPLLGSSSHALSLRKDGTPSLSLFTGRAPSLNGLQQPQQSASRASSPGRASQASSVAAVRPRVGISSLRSGATTPRSGRPEFK